jgi:phosphatidylglycerol---prolipoprotein diacylglyceryl transferase
MADLLGYIFWNVKPQIFEFGGFEVRWYGFLFALGFLIGQYILISWYKKEGKSEKDVERITMYVVISTVIGARLGHCFFYEPAYYFSNPIEILKVWKGGLASHGAAAGILFGLYIYARKTPGQSYLYVLDRVVILVALGGGFIRMGNLMNSEIIGKQADLPWSIIYTYSSESRIKEYFPGVMEEIRFRERKKVHPKVPGRVPLQMKISMVEAADSFSTRIYIESQVLSTIETDSELSKYLSLENKASVKIPGPGQALVNLNGIPRHPTQLYESISYFLIAFFLYFFIYRREKEMVDGKIFSWFLILLFGIRFFHEFFKENQVGFEDGISYNMGQLLSIPLVATGLYLYFFKVRPAEKKKNLSE